MHIHRANRLSIEFEKSKAEEDKNVIGLSNMIMVFIDDRRRRKEKIAHQASFIISQNV